jgi:magnesium transporter
MTITPDWLSYALVDSVTDSFAPIILQVEMEAVSIDELSMVLKKSEQPDMLKRISRCRKRSTQLARLLNAKLDVIKSLMKRYEDKSREYLLSDHSISDDMTTVDEKKSFNDVLLYLGDIQGIYNIK